MRSGPGLSRRALLAAAATLAAPGARAQGAALRVATIDWALLETLLGMGITPVAAAELVLFRTVAVEPPVPPSVIDIGLRGAPNFEALRLARPSLIFSSNYYAEMEPKLRLVAPVETISIYRTGDPPFARAEAAAVRIGAVTGREDAARALIADVTAQLVRDRANLAGHAGRPVLVLNLGDARHFRVFGADSLFGEVLGRLGLANAWGERTSYAASAPIGLEALARFPEAFLIVLRPVPPDAARVLGQSVLWNALPNIRDRRLAVLDSVDPFGGLPAAARFARLLSAALRAEGDAAGRGGDLG
ncbi:iron complex transport system substrate-binding protein [Ancylobacter aquaticus]|uniref:Iron complex transport system substrate-binding protein n=1 Tax=Ancylobacter aquaticus TaxID=100 RepID=A0A4R1I4R0_ANCAQ|nr:ABC transporter substrate-binding protein [Ancylobacter aquaticus]TCK30304.1 iron complex transport system substrate-binding protein [Ancylobacter aquaticus]